MDFEKFISLVKNYNPEEVETISKAYKYAERLHSGQMRQSGEPYIIHPLNVAFILAEMHADKDTVCAGLLHDVLEDCPVTKKELANDFNENIANLVDGVTKISKMNFSSKEEANYANTRKILSAITNDVRVIIIKLADRLHNMRTLEFKSEYKQKENAMETMELYVPLAYYIGAYRIKSELEDISLRYLKPDLYFELEGKSKIIEEESKDSLLEISNTIGNALQDENIPYELKTRTKNIYGIYKRLNNGGKISDIHDLLALKIMVEEIGDCYRTLGIVHKNYNPINNKFKDYLYNPKTNMYRSLHTTLFGPDDKLVQTQIRTFDMDKIASFGLCSYWDINKGQAREVMQKDLKEKYQFFKSLIEINSMFSDNQLFVKQVKEDILANKIYVYTSNGDIVELPVGATAVDFMSKINRTIVDSTSSIIINDNNYSLDTVLKNKDRVKFTTRN